MEEITMKKLALVLVLILIMGCACAEPVKLSSLEEVNSMLYANLVYVRGNNGYYLMDFNGNQLTEDIYSSNFRYRSGLVMTYLAQGEGINRRGALHEDGSVAIPFQYGDVQVLNSHWAYGVTLVEATRDNYDYEVTSGDETKVYLINTVDIYSWDTGKMQTLTRDAFLEAYANSSYINICDRSTGKVTTYDANFNALGQVENDSIYSDEFATFKFNKFYEDGKYGAKDENGNVIVEPIYPYLFWPKHGDFVVIENADDEKGLMDTQGNVIIEPQFDEIEFMRYMPYTMDSSYSYGGYVQFIEDGKRGFATSAGITCEAKYSTEILKNNGVSCSFTDMEGNYNIMAADGVITTITGYESVEPASYAGGFYYIVSGENYTRGLIDWHGNVVFPCEYKKIEFSGDGQYVLVSSESYGDIDVYTLNEAEEAAPAAAEVAAEEPAAQTGIGSVQVPNVDFSGMSAPAAQEAPAAEAPAAQAPAANAALNASCINMLTSAKSLLVADAAANGAAVQVLIEGTVSMLAGTPAAAVLDGAKALIAADAAANSAAIITLIDSAISML